ncbi:DUF4203 domain-containing protein [Candidatus Saccharibacteria bacterium]|nr:DUF4203 domain-containing protein [Candidatus Saccharibacteria bacterium]
MEEIIRSLEVPQLVLVLGLGVLVLLFGYRIKKVAFFIAWFLLGYIGMNYLMPQITEWWPVVAETQLYQILVPIGGGLLLALLGFSIEKLCVSGICFALTMLVGIQYFGTEMQTITIAAVVGVLIAGAAVMLMKPATIIATSGVGAYAVTVALLMLIAGISQNEFYWPMLIGFTAMGSIFQFLTTKRVS